MGDRASAGDPRTIRVWHAHVTDAFAAEGREAQAVTRLGPTERARYDRFRRDEDRRMFLLGRLMARRAVGAALGVDPWSWAWREGTRGRPEIDRADCSISFNLAHSAGLVVCAISSLGLVGIDVESRERARLDSALVERCCAPDEAADVRASGAAWADRFLQYWTLKESYLKAVGLGISVPLEEVRFSIDPAPRARFTGSLAGADAGWSFTLTTLGAAYYVAIAAAPCGDARPPAIDYALFEPYPDDQTFAAQERPVDSG